MVHAWQDSTWCVTRLIVHHRVCYKLSLTAIVCYNKVDLTSQGVLQTALHHMVCYKIDSTSQGVTNLALQHMVCYKLGITSQGVLQT